MMNASRLPSMAAAALLALAASGAATTASAQVVVEEVRRVQASGDQGVSMVFRSDGGRMIADRISGLGFELSADMLQGLTVGRASAAAPVVIRSLPFAAPIPTPLYYLDGVRVPAEVGKAVPAAQIATVQVTQPASDGARSIIRITSVNEADKVIAAVATGGSSIANVPEAALYTSIARVVAGTDSVQPVNAIYIGRMTFGVATEVVPSQSLSPVEEKVAMQKKAPDDASAAARATVDKLAASGYEMLVVVDGVVQSGSNVLATLDQSTFASLEIVKGEAAARMYGSGAENGVVVITTKRIQNF
jgi:hypothetical protein